jgi:anti-sigma B factor antagonist
VRAEAGERGVGDDLLIVQLEGDLDVVTAGPVGDQLCSLVELGDTVMEVDCSAVTFIESRGLAMMARVQRLANESGCRLSWRGLPLHVLRTIHLSGLDQYLRIEA